MRTENIHECTGVRCITSCNTHVILISEGDMQTDVHMHALTCLELCLCADVCMSSPTYLMSNGKRSVKTIVFDDGAASLRRADGADVRHAQGVAGVVAAEVLDKGNTVSQRFSK